MPPASEGTVIGFRAWGLGFRGVGFRGPGFREFSLGIANPTPGVLNITAHTMPALGFRGIKEPE